MANDVVSNFAQFPWAALITAFAGLAGALGGAWLANKFADNRWERQVSFEKEKEYATVLRDRGEELHTLLSKWVKYVGSIHIHQLMVLSGRLTQSQLQDFTIKNPLGDGVHDRLETLLYLYFSEYSDLMKDAREYLSKINEIFNRESKRNDCSALACEQLNHYADKFDDAIEKLKKEIRNKVSIS